MTSGNVGDCKLNKNQNPFDILPGLGWDNLANQELGQVLRISYKQCLSSNDGKYIIPDNSLFSPIKKSIVQMNSDLFDHFSNYTSITSKSINVDASYATPNYQISGSFSWEKKDIKNSQLKEKSAISRVQLRYELYTMAFQPDSELNPQFRNRILDLGALLKNGEDSIYPQYLADLLVRDFGTHVIRSVDAGAILSKTDILKYKYVTKYADDKTNISAAASFSLTKIFSINIRGNYNQENEKLEEFNENCANTRIDTLGGKPFRSNFTLNDWEESMETNLVTVDRRGDPLFHVITPRSVPEFDDKTVYQISNLIKDSINRYYSANTRVGCMNMQSKNFNDDANIDSGTCEEPELLYNIGGVFQTCSGDPAQCAEISQINLATGAYSCPSGFDEIKLQSGLNKCQHFCRLVIFTVKCEYICSNYELYWCAPTNKTTSNEGYLFGGIFTNTYPNPVTNSYTCPQNYLAFQFGITAKICLSLERGKGIKDNLPFGGFYSCNMGNPLSENVIHETTVDPKYWSKSCSPGYSGHMAVVNRGCQISYCVKSNSLSGKEQPPLHRPPFIDLQFGPNVTMVKSFQTAMGYKLSLTSTGQWKPDEKTDSLRHNVIFIVISSVVFTCFIVVLALVATIMYRRRQERILKSGYQEL